MQVTCPSCSSSFNVPDDMIPSLGRKLRCSKCKHQWHFIPTNQNKDSAAQPPNNSDAQKNKINYDDLVYKPQTSALSGGSGGGLGSYTAASIPTPTTKIDEKKSSDISTTNIKTIPSEEKFKDPIVAIKEEIASQKKYHIPFVTTTLLLLLLGIVIFIFNDHDHIRSKHFLLDKTYSLLGIHDETNLVFQDASFQFKKMDNSNILQIQGKIRNISNFRVNAPYLRVLLKSIDNKVLDERVVPYMASQYIEPNQILNIDYPMPLYKNPLDIKYVEMDIGGYFEFFMNLR